MDNKHQSTVTIIRPGHTFEGKQGLTYGEGIFAGNTRARPTCLPLPPLRPGVRSRDPYHELHGTAIYVLGGESARWNGDDLAEPLPVKAAEFLYTPAGVPHLPYNPSETEPCTVVLARTDPNEQESVVLL